ncbi:hypothetical protein Salat_1146100 [Sesamum alatum]|uniref:Uncharacterized protein n=1 Tax=Sesamum alatum TaxID=300844 RepID=A0AAE2CNA7_9LAMI|nr:hypothetical protein Salat_1146100 [Sesamum alatum]
MFDVIVDLRVFDELVTTWNKCLFQIQHLQSFKEDFDVSQLDLDNNENLEPYEDEAKVIDVLIENEFYSLLPPKAMHPFIMSSRFNPGSGGNPSNIPAQAGSPLLNQVIHAMIICHLTMRKCP